MSQKKLVAVLVCLPAIFSSQMTTQVAGPQVSVAKAPRLLPPDDYVLDFVSTAASGVAMNNFGDVAGTSYQDVGCGPFCLPPQDTVVWRAGNRIVLPSVPGLTGIYVKSINNQGWVVGVAGAPYTINHAVVWKPVGAGYQAIDLGTLPGTNTSTAVGIDDQNRVIGWSTTTNFPPNGSPFLWTETGGMVDLSAQGYPDESPLSISPGGTVATYDKWYRLGNPGSINTMVAPPPGYGSGGPAVINDAGDQGRILSKLSGGKVLSYLFRYHHEGSWQQLSSIGTGSLTTYGVGAINNNRDVTGTVLGTAVIAYGPNGLAQSLGSLISLAYPGAVVTLGGPMNASGKILAQVLIGNSPRLVRLTPAWKCVLHCMKVSNLTVDADFIPDPSDPSQDHCSPELNAHNEALVNLTVTNAAGVPMAGAVVSGRFLDQYWTNDPVVGTTDFNGNLLFPYSGPCGVGAITFFIDGVSKPGFVLDKTTGVLSGWDIPQ